MERIKKNKKGWIKIVEAFTSILLIAGILLIILNRVDVTIDISQQIYDSEYAILREIQLNDSLRDEILSLTIPLDGIEDNSPGFPKEINVTIDKRKPDHLGCEAKICQIDGNCILNLPPINRDIFVQSAIITANLDTYSRRELKLFCWNK